MKRSQRELIAGRWSAVTVPGAVRPYLHESTKGYQRDVHDGHLSVLVAHEPKGWHLSISHRRNFDLKPGRYPTWDEIADARYQFVPNEVTMAMILPPREQYVNLHETTFHMHEIPTEDPFS